ncbi:MAG: hypothetical protein AAB440_03175 [Patescibacteria group bacterium]
MYKKGLTALPIVLIVGIILALVGMGVYSYSKIQEMNTIKNPSPTKLMSNETGPNYEGHDGFPTVIGQCEKTNVAAIEFDSSREDYNVSFSNTGLIIINSSIKPTGFAVGDPVNFCYVGHADPSVCEESGAMPGDLRPYVYNATNLNTGVEIEGTQSSHLCGGA